MKAKYGTGTLPECARNNLGNYNVNTLVTILKCNLLSGFSVTYNSIQNKLIFTNAAAKFMFIISPTCWQILRFNINWTISSTSLSLTFGNCVNVYTIRTIQVNLNLITYNINKFQKK